MYVSSLVVLQRLSAFPPTFAPREKRHTSFRPCASEKDRSSIPPFFREGSWVWQRECGYGTRGKSCETEDLEDREGGGSMMEIRTNKETSRNERVGARAVTQ